MCDLLVFEKSNIFSAVLLYMLVNLSTSVGDFGRKSHLKCAGFDHLRDGNTSTIELSLEMWFVISRRGKAFLSKEVAVQTADDKAS